jgi:galactose mutarotase-like enzyme
MEYILENKNLLVRVCSLGAELTGLYSKQTETEYLWQPGGEIWPHSSLLLFPNPGRIAHDRILVDGKVYPAMMHGFAANMEFACAAQTDTRLVLELAACSYTRKYYPYEFCLQVEFVLEEDRLVQNLRVINKDEKAVYYCLGAHPGFYCPIGLNEKAEDYALVFDRPQNLNSLEMQANTRLTTGKELPYLQNETTIPLHDRFFDNGPMLFGNMASNTITLKSEKSGRFVELGVAGFTNLCLWGMGTQMSIIAIEPWIGTSDRFDTDHVWERKPGIQCLETGETRTHTLTFRVG